MKSVAEVLAADMAYRVMIDPDWGDPDQIEAIRDAYGTAAVDRRCPMQSPSRWPQTITLPRSG